MKYGKEEDKHVLRGWSEKEACDGLVMSREWMKYAFRNKRCTGKLRDSGEYLVGQGWTGEMIVVKKNLQRMGLTWEEIEASAQDRHSWRQRVALCIGDAGWIKVKVKVNTISIVFLRHLYLMENVALLIGSNTRFCWCVGSGYLFRCHPVRGSTSDAGARTRHAGAASVDTINRATVY